MVNWEKSLENGSWFHWTGITPALTKGSFET
jgi:2-dehydro-3-deoxygluconokinase